MGISLGFILVQVTMLVVTVTWLILMFFSTRIERRFDALVADKKHDGTYEQWADENKKAVVVKKWSLAALIFFAVALGLSLVFGRTEHGFSIWTPVIFWLIVLCTSIEYVARFRKAKKVFTGPLQIV